jgi:HSP20 family protein
MFGTDAAFNPVNAKEKMMPSLTRYDPLDDFFRGFFVRPVEMSSSIEAPTIKIDVKEQEKAFVVHAEMPGIKKEDIHVSIDGPTVSISAERKEEKEVKEGERVLRSERYFGKVSRSFQLGQDIDDSQASAKFTDGVLELTLPKKAATQATRLNIA